MVEREESDRRRSGEVEMEDGGRPAAVKSATGARNWNPAVSGDWGLTFLKARE